MPHDYCEIFSLFYIAFLPQYEQTATSTISPSSSNQESSSSSAQVSLDDSEVEIIAPLTPIVKNVQTVDLDFSRNVEDDQIDLETASSLVKFIYFTFFIAIQYSVINPYLFD